MSPGGAAGAVGLSLLVSVVLATWTDVAVPGESGTPDANAAGAVSRKLSLLERLLDRSADVARNERQGPQGEFGLPLARARDAHALALTHLRRGDYEAADQALDSALRTISEVSRKTADPGDALRRGQKRYEALSRRGRSFIDAYTRARADRRDVSVDFDESGFREALTEAERLSKSQRYDAANALIQPRLEALERALIRLRHRETLVHSIRGESPEDIFAHELQRNESHRMLIQLMISEREQSASHLSLIEALIERDRVARERAMRLHEEGDVGRAIESLEQATEELTRALRLSGVTF